MNSIVLINQKNYKLATPCTTLKGEKATSIVDFGIGIEVTHYLFTWSYDMKTKEIHIVYKEPPMRTILIGNW
jgi:hypothetical protein